MSVLEWLGMLFLVAGLVLGVVSLGLLSVAYNMGHRDGWGQVVLWASVVTRWATILLAASGMAIVVRSVL